MSDERDDDVHAAFEGLDRSRALPHDLRDALLASHAELDASAALAAAARRRPLPAALRRRLLDRAPAATWTRAAAVAVVVLLVAGGVAATRDGGRPSDTLDVAAPRATTTTAPIGDAAVASAPDSTGVPVAPTSPSTTARPPAPPSRSRPPALLAAASCDDLLAGYRTRALDAVTPYGIEGATRLAAVDTATGGPAAAPAESAAPASSRTNVQEDGVDEPDLVKTDGRRLFAVDHGEEGTATLRSLVVDGTTVSLVATTDLPAYVTSILLEGDRLIALGAMYEPDNVRAAIWTYDVADPAHPRLLHVRTVEGYVVTARAANGVVRVVVHTPPQGPKWTYPRDDTEAEKQRALEENRRAVQASTLGDWVPQMRAEDLRGGSRSVTEGPICACDDAMRPRDPSGLGHVSLLTIDPSAPERADAVSIEGGAATVYASPAALYATTSAWKQDRPVETVVHRFVYEGRGPARYDVSGAVPGAVLNQFSMSEHRGDLRIATTTVSGESSESRVTVLRRAGDRLAEIGSVGGLGKGERIYAVRFLGDTGYVVTFRQVDPLYVLDLREPTNPQVTGELKITGYSAYLHPTDPGRIVGVGQEASEEGRRLGTQISLFDVSDPRNPRRADQEQAGEGSSSVAEFDHHAFLWWAPTRTLAVPVIEHATDRDAGKATASALVLRATPDTLEVRGRITHARHADDWARGIIMRTIVVGPSLLTISDAGLLVSDLETLAERQWVAL